MNTDGLICVHLCYLFQKEELQVMVRGTRTMAQNPFSLHTITHTSIFFIL